MKYDVELTLTEEMLGTAPNNPEIYDEFVASKRAEGVDDEEGNTLPVDEEIERGTTVFHRTAEGKPFIYDYLIKGFFKDACSALRRCSDTASAEIKAFKKEIDGLVFIFPRQILLELPAAGSIGLCQRPLRAQTQKGERVSLARSETVPPGTILKFQVQLLSEKLSEALYEWLEYGALKGLGQWRNSGKGRFTARIEKMKTEKVENQQG